MKREERGLLLVEKEEAEKDVERLKRELKAVGELLSQIGEGLATQPERVRFRNAPGDLGSFGPEVLSGPSFDWSQVGDMAGTARMIQDLRAAVTRLERLE